MRPTVPTVLPRTRRRLALAAFATGSLVALAACGSKLSQQQLAAANGALITTRTASDLQGAAPGVPGAAVDGAAVGGDVAGAAPTDAGGSAPADSGTVAGSNGAPAGSAGGAGAVAAPAVGANGAASTAGSPGTTGPTGSATKGGSTVSAPSGGKGTKPGATTPAKGAATGAPGKARASTAAVAPSAAASNSVMTFGSFGNSAGALGAVSGPAPPGTVAWQQYVNAHGGLNGHPVKIIVADDGGDPAKAQSIAQRMVEQDHVLAIFNEFGFGEIISAMPYLKSKGVPVIGSIGADSRIDADSDIYQPLTGASLGIDWGFALALNAATQHKKIALLYCREAATCAAEANGFKSILPFAGLNVVYTAQVSLVQPDFTSEMIGAKSAGADIVLDLVDSASLIRTAQSAHQQSYTPVFAGAYNLALDVTLSGAKDLDGLVLFGRTPPYSTSTLPDLVAYRQAMAQYEPDQPKGDVGAGAFIIGALLQKIAPQFGANPTSATIVAALNNVHGEKLGGELPGITFPQQDDRSHVNECVFPQTLTGGQFVSVGGLVCAPGWQPGT